MSASYETRFCKIETLSLWGGWAIVVFRPSVGYAKILSKLSQAVLNKEGHGHGRSHKPDIYSSPAYI